MTSARQPRLIRETPAEDTGTFALSHHDTIRQRQRNDPLLPLADCLKRTVLEKTRVSPSCHCDLDMSPFGGGSASLSISQAALGSLSPLGGAVLRHLSNISPAHGPELGPCLAVWISLCVCARIQERRQRSAAAKMKARQRDACFHSVGLDAPNVVVALRAAAC